jgi:serine/threonine protein kinase/Tol biopolymer transport system component
MTLVPGTRLGAYEIVSAIGAGGMGEVYKARDTRLDRTVAIKVLPPHVAADPAFRQRFEREAKTVSSLDHPHICALYDVGQDRGTDFLVMQYLEGETLADRLTKGPLALDQALKCAREIADALDKAHRRGIVHRDIKPGNVMLTKTGATLLDFGVARATAAAAGSDLSPSVTAATMTGAGPMTAEGTILGTLQYMAPEQLEGNEVDGRTDIFAFGALLYELVAGRRAFEGPSQANVIAAILDSQPPRFAELARTRVVALPHTVTTLDDLIRRCLAKNPEERWQCAGDLCAELKAIDAARAQAPTAVQQATRGRSRVTWIAAAATLVAASAVLVAITLRRPVPPPALPTRFTIPPPKDTQLFDAPYFLSISPDGRSVVFAARRSDSRVSLWLRPIDSVTSRPLPFTEGGGLAFWSPDSRHIAFMTPGILKRVDLLGGKSTTLAEATSAGSWSSVGTILFSRLDGLYQVPATGGEAQQVTKLDASRGETAHLWPAFLPDGRRFILYVRSTKPEHQGLYVGSLDSTERTRISDAASSVAYVPGYLLFARQRTLMAQPFDEQVARVVGEATAVVPSVQHSGDYLGYAAFAASISGALIYREGASESVQLTLADRAGTETPVGPPMSVQGFDVSPDGRYVAVAGQPSPDVALGVHLIDTARGVFTPLAIAAEGESLMDPVWAPDGRMLAYTKRQDGRIFVASRPAFGGTERTLFEGDGQTYIEDWSRDGKYLAVTTRVPEGHRGIIVPIGGGKPVIVGESRGYFDELAFSPDGRWLAYDSNESERTEVYVVPLPPTGERWQISPNGGAQPRWRTDGRELMYIAPDGTIMGTPIVANTRFEAGMPKRLLKTRLANPSAYEEQYRLLPDGRRFLIKAPLMQDRPPITVVLNWHEELETRPRVPK